MPFRLRILGHGCRQRTENTVAQENSQKRSHQRRSHLFADRLFGAAQRTHGEHHPQHRGHNSQTGKRIRHGRERVNGFVALLMVRFQIDLHHGVDFGRFGAAGNRHAQRVAQEMRCVVVF